MASNGPTMEELEKKYGIKNKSINEQKNNQKEQIIKKEMKTAEINNDNTQKKICKYCGFENSWNKSEYIFELGNCTNCHKWIGYVFCPYCDAKVNDTDDVCPNCEGFIGKIEDFENYLQNEKQKILDMKNNEINDLDVLDINEDTNDFEDEDMEPSDEELESKDINDFKSNEENRRITGLYTMIISGIICFVFIIIINDADYTSEGFLISAILALFSGIGAIYGTYIFASADQKIKKNNNLHWLLENKEKYELLEDNYYSRLDYYKKYGVKSNDIYVYIDKNNKLHFLFPLVSFNECCEKKSIPGAIPEYISNFSIKYYKLEGSKRKEQYITGGGSSLGGAVVGSFIAGDAGAIIGSRKKTETEYKEVDDRVLVITYENDATEILNFKCYEFFLKVIPEKDYDNYIENLKSKGRK